MSRRTSSSNALLWSWPPTPTAPRKPGRSLSSAQNLFLRLIFYWFIPSRRFQRSLANKTAQEVGYGVFARADRVTSTHPIGYSEFLGSFKVHSFFLETFSLILLCCRDVRGKDVIIIDDIVDTAGTLSTLCRQMAREGANKVNLDVFD